jgi:hypothetical protein
LQKVIQRLEDENLLITEDGMGLILALKLEGGGLRLFY